ncbi:hypothetical protein B484DRAFT_441039 [Ochromonadaceae sp. CCMP2298]|nr:hypothetical protein B484DRAFT_441039 [Ochromonadaceae sp. CCMP2298]
MYSNEYRQRAAIREEGRKAQRAAQAVAQAVEQEQNLTTKQALAVTISNIIRRIEYFNVTSRDGNLCWTICPERDDLLRRIGFVGSEDVEYLADEDVGALAAMMKPVPHRRLQKVWAKLRAMQNA